MSYSDHRLPDWLVRSILVILFVSMIAPLGAWVLIDIYTHYQCQVNLRHDYCEIRNPIKCDYALFGNGTRCISEEEFNLMIEDKKAK